ncbi:MAG TPA: chloride channel protein [Thermoleophilaceae bacterium]|nr:chloride channel protein [Thermoleophilaceae bacterium]
MPDPPPDSGRGYVRTLLVAAALGPVAAALALVFTGLVHQGTHLVWDSIPDHAGWGEPPWWYVLAVPLAGAALVAGALRLPGHGGATALEGLRMDAGRPSDVFGVLLAALASLVAGVVLGPEAPLTALGLAVGVTVARLIGADPTQTRLLGLAGAFAMMAALFGGPLPSSLLFFEMLAASGALAAANIGRALVPGLLAAGTGSLLFTGVRDWQGVHQLQLAVPGLPDYPTVQLRDVAWCVLVAAVAGSLVALARPCARRLAAYASGRVVPALLAGGLAIGLLAVIFRAVTDRPVDLVLFSGQSAVPSLVAESSAGVLAAVAAFKGLGYVVSLASGFRGGPIFPAVTLGVAVGGAAAAALPSLALTPAIVAGMAAGAAGGMRLPFFGAVLAALLAGPSYAQTTPLAVVGAVVGWLAALIVDRVTGEPAAGETSAAG